MNNDPVEKARRALRSIPLFVDIDLQGLKIERLGGLTNLVFRVSVDQMSDGNVSHNNEAFCLRLPGEGTDEYINRIHEAQAAREAARAGVSPEVLYSDESGVMVSRYIENTCTMTPELFKSRAGSPARAGKAFAKLHHANLKFDFRFELFDMIDEYLRILSAREVEFPIGYHDVLNDAETVRQALNAHTLPLTACHCDPLCENFLDTGQRMWIVDWEYSGMNDPLWDLGDLSVEAGFDESQDEEMIQAYFEGEPRPDQRGRIVIYKAMCDLLWTLWGLIQYANDNPAEDFWAYSSTRFSRCRTLMQTHAFKSHVRAVAAGGK